MGKLRLEEEVFCRGEVFFVCMVIRDLRVYFVAVVERVLRFSDVFV